jgi:hypothetical protein
MASKLARHVPTGALLTRILDEPALVSAIQDLDPRVLGKLIQHIGLEDAGEIVALATSAQLAQVFDEDLWRVDRPGADETFDERRFVTWLQILLEIGAPFAVRRIREMDEDLLTFALSRHLFVIDVDQLALRMANRRASSCRDEEDLVEKALESSLSHEFQEYLVLSRTHDGWDAIIDLLTELDSQHHDHLERLLERLCHLSSETIEESGGLHHVLGAGEMIESDVAGAREQRREQQGFVAPSAATSFLALARSSSLSELVQARDTDPVSKAYFRSFHPVASAPASASTARATPGTGAARAAASAPDQLLGLLAASGVLPDQPSPRLLQGASGRAGDEPLPLHRALWQLRDDGDRAHERRTMELNYLANLLLAGCSRDGRPLRPAEAAQAVLATCNLGLEHLLSAGEDAPPPAAGLPGRMAALLASQELMKPFQIGWHLLHHQLCLPAAHALVAALTARSDQLAPADPARAELADLAAHLRRAIAAGKPWTARGVRDRLRAHAPELAWLQPLIDHCPSAPRSAAQRRRRGRPRVPLQPGAAALPAAAPRPARRGHRTDRTGGADTPAVRTALTGRAASSDRPIHLLTARRSCGCCWS